MKESITFGNIFNFNLSARLHYSGLKPKRKKVKFQYYSSCWWFLPKYIRICNILNKTKVQIEEKYAYMHKGNEYANIKKARLGYSQVK